MKKETRLWILWHLILAVAVATGFFIYRQHVLHRAIVINSEYLDEGIPAGDLKFLIKKVEDDHPDCRILSLRKYYSSFKIDLAWIDNAYKGATLFFSETNGEWKQSSDVKSPIEGISPSDMVSILAEVAAQTGGHIDKRVLKVTIQDGKVVVKTGVTNHSLGGGGNTFHFEKKDSKWIFTGTGNWIS